MNSGRKITVAHINSNHLEGIVGTHKKAFENYFLTNLGDAFLRRYYHAFLEDQQTIAIGAFEHEALVGFILCSKNKPHVLRNFYCKNLGFMVGCLFRQLFLGNKIIWSGFLSRVKTGTGVIKSFVTPRNEEPAANQENTRLLSIGVLPQFQGLGVSTEMMSFLHDRLEEDHVNSVGLSVKKENTRAIKFYEKMGWQIDKTEKQTVYFVKNF